MTQRLTLPTDILQELLEVHEACEREAIAIFLEGLLQEWQADVSEKARGNVS